MHSQTGSWTSQPFCVLPLCDAAISQRGTNLLNDSLQPPLRSHQSDGSDDLSVKHSQSPVLKNHPNKTHVQVTAPVIHLLWSCVISLAVRNEVNCVI